MFTKSKSKATGPCQVCSVSSIILSVIVALSTIASLIGVYKAHFLSSGLTFGISNGSLALIALALNLFLVKKVMMGCPCQCSMKK